MAVFQPRVFQTVVFDSCEPTFQQTVFQPDIFSQCEGVGAPSAVHGAIAQTLPALGQSLHGTSGAEVPPTLTHLVPITPKRVLAEIHQTLPALMQSIEASVTDDELVLLMI